MTPDEADALRVRLTATQSQRLRELGADPLVLDELFPDVQARDAAFKRLEGDLVTGRPAAPAGAARGQASAAARRARERAHRRAHGGRVRARRHAL